MSDKDLLELAARAAGIRCDLSEPSIITGARHQCFFDADGYQFGWNPLESDGDALRLAVKLDIEFYQGDDDGPSVYAGYWSKPERRDVTRLFAVEPISGDPYAATRRAIVRAAAEIGKGME